jgi:hypothetical protein
MLAPIFLFVFSRPYHTNQTLTALSKNRLARQSNLFIYADAARNKDDVDSVNEVREIARAAKGFRSCTIIEREKNYGLAKNIIDGVTEVCNRYGRAIVLEDDVVTSSMFLSFMNAALDKYTDVSDVWHISGWNYPISPDELGDAFFWRVMNCWGWATWSDRWKYFKKNPDYLVSSWGKEKIKKFNLDGAHNFWDQVVANNTGMINTWAIFWYATIFENHGLCLNPSISFAQNIGNDGTGMNCEMNNSFDVNKLSLGFNKLPNRYEESPLAVERIKNFYSDMPSFRKKLIARIKSIFRKRNEYSL